MTACRGRAELPSEITAKAMFFWRRIDLTQPFTCTRASVVGALRSWRMVGGRMELEAARPSILQNETHAAAAKVRSQRVGGTHSRRVVPINKFLLT